MDWQEIEELHHAHDIDAAIAHLDAGELAEIAQAYNWDDGYAVPAALVRHPRMDRGLALQLFWEIDDTARLHVDSPGESLEDIFSSLVAHEPENFAHLTAYVTTLVRGLQEDRFSPGPNVFDTGFFGTQDPSLTDRQRKIREINTRRARETYAEGLLRPEPAIGPPTSG